MMGFVWAFIAIVLLGIISEFILALILNAEELGDEEE